MSAEPAVPRIAVLLPCYNEVATIEKVVTDFHTALPAADVYVFDNNSTDGTADAARGAGARVVRSPRQGKGHVVQHMFRLVDADIYIMADGDDTYPAADAQRLIDALIEAQVDMVVGSRLQSHEGAAFRPLHVLGNSMFAALVTLLFHVRLQDILSGYRVFSRRFVRSMPLTAGGFGIETDMTLNALAKGIPILEVPIHYGSRPEGSVSKLNTWTDGVVILSAILLLFKDYKPLAFFSVVSVFLACLSLSAGYFPIAEYMDTGIVTRQPLAVLAASLGVLSTLAISVGLILDTSARYHREVFFLLAQNAERREPDGTHEAPPAL